MSATSIPTTGPLVQAPPTPPRGARWSRRRLLGSVVGLVAAAALAGSAVNLATPTNEAILPAEDAAVPQGLAIMPDTPVDGVLTMRIPLGASADQQAGGRGYTMPDVINLTVGDKIVIHNDDDAPHMILYTFLLPGQSDTRTFTSPGSEVYSSGCGLHAAAILNFTTIFVHEPAGERS
ncbi:MAG: hypothetical protein KC442_07515 [Thermomicrobiales bacterium]|nr:hypothetical protein [Thermomicrobiales bacterium]MCA9877612.1 hypothetical protein [Thermomicrobiales bacterium]